LHYLSFISISGFSFLGLGPFAALGLNPVAALGLGHFSALEKFEELRLSSTRYMLVFDYK
jgi:hypothetical protein